VPNKNQLKEFVRTLWSGNGPEQEETTAEFVQSMAAMLVVGLFLVTFNLQAFEIPSGSMISTLLIGDHVLVDRITAAPESKWIQPLMPYREIKHGDIIVFLHPAEPGLHVVKRIIGVPGDRIHLKDGKVYRNGEIMNESYVQRDGTYEPYRDEFPGIPANGNSNVTATWQVELPALLQGQDLVVPSGKYFAMGDNRDSSLDSRFWGLIPRENIVGRPMFIYWSFVTPDDQYRKTNISDRSKFLGHILLHIFDETRWKRTLKFVR
jgi:signal peptidase I